MESLYLLIPLSAGLVLLILGVFGWAVHRGQFDDLADEAERILDGDDAPVPGSSAPALTAADGPQEPRAALPATTVAQRPAAHRTGVDADQCGEANTPEESRHRS